MDELKVRIGSKEYKIKVTLGFWKKCGFTREQAEIISQDPEKLIQAIKLAVFYGNKEEYNWNNLEDMLKNIPESDFESIDEDCSDIISRAMVYYLPEKMRKVILDRINKTEEEIGQMIDQAMDQKKNQSPGIDTSLN